MQIRKYLFGFDLILAAAALAVLWSIIMLQVILRSIFNAPLMGADELTPYLLVWVIVSPMGSIERENGHIIMEELLIMLPGIVIKVLRFLIRLGVVAIYIVMSLSVIMVFRNNINNVTALLKMPFWLFFLPTAVGFFSITIISIVRNLCLIFKKELPAW